MVLQVACPVWAEWTTKRAVQLSTSKTRPALTLGGFSFPAQAVENVRPEQVGAVDGVDASRQSRHSDIRRLSIGRPLCPGGPLRPL